MHSKFHPGIRDCHNFQMAARGTVILDNLLIVRYDWQTRLLNDIDLFLCPCDTSRQMAIRCGRRLDRHLGKELTRTYFKAQCVTYGKIIQGGRENVERQSARTYLIGTSRHFPDILEEEHGEKFIWICGHWYSIQDLVIEMLPLYELSYGYCSDQNHINTNGRIITVAVRTFFPFRQKKNQGIYTEGIHYLQQVFLNTVDISFKALSLFMQPVCV